MSKRDARRLLRVGLVGGTAFVAALAGASSPAAAHGASGAPASNFHTTVVGIDPEQDGVHVGVGPDGEQLQLRVDGPATVVILGYDDEPYLRVSRAGGFENRSSPAVAANRTRIPTGTADRGPIGPPRWVRVSSDPVVTWHDHRAHWMGGSTPTSARQGPDRAHTVGRFAIPLRIDGTPARLAGTIRWEPPPSAAAWWGVAILLAVAVLLGARWRARPVLAASLVVLAAGEALHAWGSWPFSTASVVGRLGESIPSIATVATVVAALVWLARRSVWSAAPLLVLAGLFAAVAGGVADLDVLSHSWVPSRLAPDVARLLVVVALGVGSGVAIAGVLALRAPRPSAEPSPPPETPPSSS